MAAVSRTAVCHSRRTALMPAAISCPPVLIRFNANYATRRGAASLTVRSSARRSPPQQRAAPLLPQRRAGHHRVPPAGAVGPPLPQVYNPQDGAAAHQPSVNPFPISCSTTVTVVCVDGGGSMAASDGGKSSDSTAGARRQQKRPKAAVGDNFLETATLPQLRRYYDSRRASAWYSRALELTRQGRWEKARLIFKATTEQYPNLCRAWVSWAQMEKKAGGRACVGTSSNGRALLDFDGCRTVLQRGLELNPSSSCLCQAWGLMELQRGNATAAVKLIDRSVEFDRRCEPVQRWRLYKEAQQAMTASSRRRPSPATACHDSKLEAC